MKQCMDSENLHRRLKKILGQVQAIDRMIDEDIPCEDILAQINAAKSALNGCGKVVLEGHIQHCVRDGIQHGDADKLDFPDESFDAVVSNYVYHNVMGADKQALLLETLRVLKKGGVFALNDDMKPKMYGDMDAFVQKLRDMGYEDVRLIDTATEVFGSRRRAGMMMLGDSRMLVGRK